MSELFKDLGIEVDIKKGQFNVIRETLTRMGIPSHHKKSLTQSCHLFHKKGRYAIMHFKEMLKFDGKEVNIENDDLKRRDTIVKLLSDWGLIECIEKIESEVDLCLVKVIPAKEKVNWELKHKYTIGK